MKVNIVDREKGCRRERGYNSMKANIVGRNMGVRKERGCYGMKASIVGRNKVRWGAGLQRYEGVGTRGCGRSKAAMV